MDWLAFFGSVIGGLIGGIFTFLGVRLTINHEEKQNKIEELKNVDKNKPRLEIVNAEEYELSVEHAMQSCADINAFLLRIKSFKEENGRAMFEYDYPPDEKKLYCYEFEMKNTGFTEIEDVCLTTNLPQNTGLMDYYRSQIYLDNKFLNYDVWSKNIYKKPGEFLSIRIMFPREKIIISNLRNATISIWLKDINGRVWCQPLYVKEKETEISKLSSRAELIEAADIKTAIECFKNPYMW